MYSAYVLINNTQCDLCYGQYHTEEELILPALSRSSYYWRTHRVKLVQQVQFISCLRNLVCGLDSPSVCDSDSSSGARWIKGAQFRSTSTSWQLVPRWSCPLASRTSSFSCLWR
jgi:hypothetical protein